MWLKLYQPRPLVFLPIALQILFAVVGRGVVLARNEEGLFGFCTFDQFGKGVEFFGLGRMRDVPGVDDEFGLLGQGVDFSDGSLQGCANVGVGRFVEAHVTVADLDEMEFSFRPVSCSG